MILFSMHMWKLQENAKPQLRNRKGRIYARNLIIRFIPLQLSLRVESKKFAPSGVVGAEY